MPVQYFQKLKFFFWSFIFSFSFSDLSHFIIDSNARWEGSGKLWILVQGIFFETYFVQRRTKSQESHTSYEYYYLKNEVDFSAFSWSFIFYFFLKTRSYILLVLSKCVPWNHFDLNIFFSVASISFIWRKKLRIFWNWGEMNFVDGMYVLVLLKWLCASRTFWFYRKKSGQICERFNFKLIHFWFFFQNNWI